jgi:hypothetical protein
MTPLRARYARGKQIARCFFGAHEYATHRQDALDATAGMPAQPGILQQRCLHCGHLTEGWLAEGPRYRQTHPGDPAKLVLHNPRLKQCDCRDCRKARVADARAARRAGRDRVTTIRRPA